MPCRCVLVVAVLAVASLGAAPLPPALEKINKDGIEVKGTQAEVNTVQPLGGTTRTLK